jgi:hypothetical protein
MKEGWWWYWTSGVLMGLVFTIIWASYKFNLVIPVEAYLLLIIVFLFSVVLFIVGCMVKKL